MKTLTSLLVLVILLLSGCASSHIATKVGDNISDSFSNSAAIGLVSADKIKSSWPYISGLIKGVCAGDFEREVPYVVQEIMGELDALCMKNDLSQEDKGSLVGLVVRLEYQGSKYFWEKYGVSLYKWFKMFTTGA
jgi:hypothetical protein